MKPPYVKRWYHDPDVVESIAAVVFAIAIVAAILWHDWQATAPRPAGSPPNATKGPTP